MDRASVKYQKMTSIYSVLSKHRSLKVQGIWRGRMPCPGRVGPPPNRWGGETATTFMSQRLLGAWRPGDVSVTYP